MHDAFRCMLFCCFACWFLPLLFLCLLLPVSRLCLSVIILLFAFVGIITANHFRNATHSSRMSPCLRFNSRFVFQSSESRCFYWLVFYAGFCCAVFWAGTKELCVRAAALVFGYFVLGKRFYIGFAWCCMSLQVLAFAHDFYCLYMYICTTEPPLFSILFSLMSLLFVLNLIY